MTLIESNFVYFCFMHFFIKNDKTQKSHDKKETMLAYLIYDSITPTLQVTKNGISLSNMTFRKRENHIILTWGWYVTIYINMFMWSPMHFHKKHVTNHATIFIFIKTTTTNKTLNGICHVKPTPIIDLFSFQIFDLTITFTTSNDFTWTLFSII